MRKLLLFVACCLIGGLYWMNYLAETSRNASEVYFHHLGLELTGIVQGVDRATSDRGVLHVQIRTSNRVSYDPRGTTSYFYCVLKHGHADLLEGGLSDVQVGDSLQISCARDSIYFYRRGLLTKRKGLYLYQTEIKAKEINQLIHL